MEEKEKPVITEKVLESWAPQWLKKYAEENGLSLADLFNFEEGRFLRMREIENPIILKKVLTQPRKPEALIDKYDFHNIQDVEKLLIDFAETHKDLFFYTAKEVVVEENVNYVMACISHDGKNATVFVNKKYEGKLLSALQSFKNKVHLTKEDEGMLLVLWHELTHLRTKDLFKFNAWFSDDESYALETVTEFIARHTYDKFLKMLRPTAKPNYQKELIKEAIGYNLFVRRLGYVLQTFKINEKEAAKELESILLEDCQNLRRRLVDWLKTKTDLSEIESDIIIYDMVNRRMSNEEFQKEVDRYYEIVKRRQKRDNLE